MPVNNNYNHNEDLMQKPLSTLTDLKTKTKTKKQTQ